MAKIAVVDDDARLLASVRSMLDGTGHTVMLFSSPTEALRALADAPVDLVISDIYMPGMNGFQFIEELRVTMPSVPVIAMSGGGRFTGGDVLGESTEHGATATLAKPVRRAELLALITTTIDPPI
jgi:DNA-binding NtrC family response regulator